jgi:hypothetical protein
MDSIAILGWTLHMDAPQENSPAPSSSLVLVTLIAPAEPSLVKKLQKNLPVQVYIRLSIMINAIGI